MAETASAKRGKRKSAFIVGLIVILLAAIGFTTIVVASINGIGTAVEKSKNYDEYEKILTPVLLIDPDSFDDITKADLTQLMEISIWSLLKSDLSPDTFESNENGLVIPKSAAEEQFVELFGTQVTPVHQTIEGYGFDFTYDSAAETYTIPLTGITPIYTPKVVDKKTSSDTVVLTVACLAGDAWEQGENGDMIEPAPDKYLKITLREKDGNLYISAIQNTTTPEIVTTTPSTDETTTENPDLLEQAEQQAVESTTEPVSQEEESSSSVADEEQ